MPSYSSRSSTVDGDYDSGIHSSPSLRRRLRSNLPVEDKLIKRRDQNRVSQRAFRQRKEKHTKELEAKVSELEQLLESASYENSLAASQMGRMGEELQYYRRLLVSDTGVSILSSPPSEKSAVSSYTNTYIPFPYDALPGTEAMRLSTGYTASPVSNRSSAHSSPDLSIMPGDFGVERLWGYVVPENPQHVSQGINWQTQKEEW